jgi:hypothetical protein
MQKTGFKIAKQSDRQIIDGFQQAARSSSCGIERWNIQFAIGGSHLIIESPTVEQHEDLNAALSLDGEALRRIEARFRLGKHPFTATVERSYGELRDQFVIDLTSVPDDLPAKSPALLFLHSALTTLKSLDREHGLLGVSDADVKRYYDIGFDCTSRIRARLLLGT